MRLAVNFNTIRCMNNVILRTLTLLLILLKCVRIICPTYMHVVVGVRILSCIMIVCVSTLL